MEELSACGVEVVFLNHAIGVTPEESLLLQMQGMIAEYERAKIMERNRRGKLHGARRGISMSCRPRRTVIATFVSNLMAHPHSTLSTWRKRQRSEPSFTGLGWSGDHWRSGSSSYCYRHVTASGKPYWDRSTVWGILQNPAYMGRAAFEKHRRVIVYLGYAHNATVRKCPGRGIQPCVRIQVSGSRYPYRQSSVKGYFSRVGAD